VNGTNGIEDLDKLHEAGMVCFLAGYDRYCLQSTASSFAQQPLFLFGDKTVSDIAIAVSQQELQSC
jgi:hypothetical protein